MESTNRPLPRRGGYEKVAEMLDCDLSTAKRAPVAYDDFPQPLRMSRKLVTFNLDAVADWAARNEGAARLIKSVRGAAEAKAKAQRLAAVDPKVRTRSERAAKRNAKK